MDSENNNFSMQFKISRRGEITYDENGVTKKVRGIIVEQSNERVVIKKDDGKIIEIYVSRITSIETI